MKIVYTSATKNDAATLFTLIINACDCKLICKEFQVPFIKLSIKIVENNPPKKCNQFPPRFGNECQHRCHCLNLTEFCNKATGHCTSGCMHGWIGDNCQTSKEF